nr:MAG TPA: hypothetical protein [Caudoviricetes sp.]
MLKDGTRLLYLVVLSLLLLCFALLATCRAEAAAVPMQRQTQQEVIVQVPLSKLKELQSITSRQEQRLNQLQELLGGQSNTLTEQQNSTNLLRQELATAKSSLATSKQIIDEQNSSLMSLSATLKQEQRRMRRVERQRLLWQAVAGGMAMALVKQQLN